MLLRRPSPGSGSEPESREGLRLGDVSPNAAPHPPLPPVPPAVTVRAASVLPGHVSFGPFPEPVQGLGPLPAELALGLYCTDTRETHYVLQVRFTGGSVQCDQDTGRTHSWMAYIQPARDRHEQNVEAIRDARGQLHFRCVRQVGKGEELYVWYGDELARQCAIPILTPAHIRGDAEYTCTRCLKSFRYPNTLKSHMRFHCPASERSVQAYDLAANGFPGLLTPAAAAAAAMAQSLHRGEHSPTDRPSGPRNIRHAEVSSAFRPHRQSPESKPHSPTGPQRPSLAASKVSPLGLLCQTNPASEKDRRLSSESKAPGSSDRPQGAALPQGLDLLHSGALGQYHPLLFQSYLDKMAMSQYNAMALYSGLYNAGIPPSYCCSRPSNAAANPCGPMYLHGLSWPMSGIPRDAGNPALAAKPPGPEPREDVPSPSQLPITAFNFPLPSDKEGEPLDLLPKSLYSSKSNKGHMCIYCGKLYSRKYGLKIHLRTHTGYKPLKCKVCQRPFGDPSNLNKHIRLHAEGETPYRCQYCGKVLVRRRDLERHIRSRHPNEAENDIDVSKTWEEENGSPQDVSDSSDPDNLDESFGDENQEIQVDV